MAIKTLEQRKRQKILLFIGVGVILITLLILYFGMWRPQNVAPESVVPESAPLFPGSEPSSMLLNEKLKIIKLDFDFLNEKILPFLKIHGKIPVEKGTAGRENPFIQY